MTLESTAWAWTETADNAFETLKEKLLVDTPILLEFPNWSAEFVQQIYASSGSRGWGIGSKEMTTQM